MTDEWTQEQLQAHAFEKGLVVTARDELANEMIQSDALSGETRAEAMVSGSTQREPFLMFADALLAAGWRKMPSKEQIEAHLEDMEFHWSQPWKGDVLDAILALMDGDNE